MARNWYDSVVPEDAAPPPREIDVTVAHPARVYDYWLGGKDNFAADRAAAERVLEAKPEIRDNVRANRRFLARAVRYLSTEGGIQQFLDIGTGIPTANNTHEVAQAVRPEARVVYVDNDPIVLAHARALLTSVAGPTMFIDSDLREVKTILSRAGETLNFSRPVAVMLIAVLHLIPDEDDPWGIVASFMDAVPSGSYLVLSHPARDVETERSARAAQRYNENVATPMHRRTRAEVARFLDGLDLVEPGLVQMHQWRAGRGDPVAPSSGYALVGRKP
jgi:S-adenosyl methyltransferase